MLAYVVSVVARVAIGYAMNQERAGWQNKHVRQVIDLVYAAL